MKDFYYKGIHYIVKRNLFNSQPIVKLTERDFRLMRDYIEELEWKLYCINKETFGPLKEKE